MKNQKKGIICLYFRDKLKTRTSGSGQYATSYTYCDAECKVHLPMISTWNGDHYNFSFQGTLPRDWDMLKFSQVLEWVRDEVENMTGVEVDTPKSSWGKGWPF